MAHAVVQINDSERESGEVVNRRGVERSASFRRFRNVSSGGEKEAVRGGNGVEKTSYI